MAGARGGVRNSRPRFLVPMEKQVGAIAAVVPEGDGTSHEGVILDCYAQLMKPVDDPSWRSRSLGCRVVIEVDGDLLDTYEPVVWSFSDPLAHLGQVHHGLEVLSSQPRHLIAGGLSKIREDKRAIWSRDG